MHRAHILERIHRKRYTNFDYTIICYTLPFANTARQPTSLQALLRYSSNRYLKFMFDLVDIKQI